jgi:sulfate permease, SulP family
VKALRLLLPTLRGFQPSWAGADLIAGLTLAAIAVPEQIATAHLANMPPVSGLYAFVAGSLLFALLGRHPTISVGADSTIAPVFAAGVAAITVAGSPAYEHLVSALAVVAGGALVIAGVARLGWVAEFFPEPVVTGALAGIGVLVLVHQLPTVLGVAGGGTTTIGRLSALARQVGQTNLWALAIAAGVLVLVVVAEKVDRRAPGALAGVVGATAVVAAAGLSRHGVRVVGAVHVAFPQIAWRGASISQVGKLAGTALTVAFICVVQISATARSNPAPGGRPKDFDLDLVAVGAGSVLAGLAGSFAVDASPPRTAATVSAGGKSQLSGLVAASLVIVLLAVASGLLKDLPEAALGAVLTFIAFRLFRVRELLAIWRFGWYELALAVITLLVVVLLGVEQGFVVAALLAIAQRLRIAARPRDAVLGRQLGGDHWIETDVGAPTEQVPGVVVYMLYAAIWYGNATRVVERALAAVDRAPPPVQMLVLDANGMSDIDYTGAKALGGMVEQLRKRGIAVRVARASHLVHQDLKHAGVLRTVRASGLFPSVEEAVQAPLPDGGPA